MIHGLRFYRASVRVEKGGCAPIFILIGLIPRSLLRLERSRSWELS
jgi:hypothetical protein